MAIKKVIDINGKTAYQVRVKVRDSSGKQKKWNLIGEESKAFRV